MSNKIISLDQHRLENSPHLSGEARCVSCGHKWIAVTSIGDYSGIECPVCKLMKGILIYGVEPDITWTCKCGCDVFCLSGKGNLLCWQCGLAQTGHGYCDGGIDK